MCFFSSQYNDRAFSEEGAFVCAGAGVRGNFVWGHLFQAMSRGMNVLTNLHSLWDQRSHVTVVTENLGRLGVDWDERQGSQKTCCEQTAEMYGLQFIALPAINEPQYRGSVYTNKHATTTSLHEAAMPGTHRRRVL